MTILAEPLVAATAGRFELLVPCKYRDLDTYKEKCEQYAVMKVTAGPLCRHCYLLNKVAFWRYEVATAEAYRIFNWLPQAKRGLADTLNSLSYYESRNQ